MATNPSSWQSKRLTALASLVVLAGLYGVMWYLMGGCEPTPPGPTNAPGKAGGDVPLEALEALGDANVKELSLHVAWFRATHGRLPADLGELRKAAPPAGWPAAPTATTVGQTIAYRPTGERTYELALPGKDNGAGGLTLTMDLPADMPGAMTAAALRTWWDLEYTQDMMQKMRQHINTLRAADK